MTNLLKILRSIFVQGPVGVFLAVVRLPLLLVFGLLSLIVGFVEWLCEFLERMNLKEEEEDDDECNPPFPEGVMRRPDPCIYSQHYLASQGLSVTWNNPDSSTRYQVVPTNTTTMADGGYCREYTTTATVGGKVETVYGRACRQPDGAWQIKS